MHQVQTKNYIRQWVRRQRKACGVSLIDAASRQIATQLIALPAFEAASIIFLYAALPLEIQTHYIEEAALKLGKKVAYPKMSNQKGEMKFYLVDSKADLVSYKYGKLIIDEPNPAHHVEVIPGKKDLMVLPGVAFDKAFNRLGYGGGYYDRYLAQHPVCKVGVCMQFQIMDQLPIEPFDQTLDALVWENSKMLRRVPNNQ